jgi:tRNA uridine 5-carboxymethylaminomethyl modification enzyme
MRPRLTEEVRQRLSGAHINDISGPCSTAHLLRRQGVTYKALMDCLQMDRCQDGEIIEEVEIHIKYSGYIKRELQQVARFKQLEMRSIPAEFSYDHVIGLSNEVREKLKRVRPASVGQASRIAGVTPAAISLLLVALEKYKKQSLPGGALSASA